MATKKKKGGVGGGKGDFISGTQRPPEELEQEFEQTLNSKDPHIVQLLSQISDVFSLFDQGNAAGSRTIDVREVGCAVRALGLYPSEADVHEIIQVVEDQASQGVIKYERFAPYLARILQDGKVYQGPSESEVGTAFQVLDHEKLGYFDIQRLKDLMLKDGEPFSVDEFEDLLRFGYNEEENKFDWRLYMKKAGLRVPDD